MAIAKLRCWAGRLAERAIRVTAGVGVSLSARRRARTARHLYLALSRLSDAELAERGLTRDDVSAFLAEARVWDESNAGASHRPKGSG
jgi:uncharacterized protein YjiS (DUF1127 family)